jgi:hypothetical protein
MTGTAQKMIKTSHRLNQRFLYRQTILGPPSVAMLQAD